MIFNGKNDLLKIIFVFSFIYGIFLRFYNIFEPFVVEHYNGFNNALYSLIARNFLRYGYIDFGLGQITNVGLVNTTNFSYYVTHPPLSAILASFSFKIFGVSEWSAQLIPFLLSIVCLFLFFSLLKPLFNKDVTVFSFFVYAISPISVLFIGHCLDVEQSIHMFFCLTLVLSYFTWIRKDRDIKYLPFIFLSLLLGIFSNWPICFLLPLIILDFIFFAKKNILSNLFFLSLFLLAILVGGFLVFIYMSSKTSDPSLVGFSGSLLNVAIRHMKNADVFTVFTLLIKRTIFFYTPFISLFIFIGFIFFVRDLFRNRFSLNNRLMCILLIWPFSFWLVIKGYFKDNVHLMYLSVPAFSLCCGIALAKIISKIQQYVRPRLISALLLLSLFYLMLSSSLVVTLEGYDYGKQGSSANKNFGQDINKNSNLTDKILIPNEYRWQLKFYADRDGKDFIKSQEDLNEFMMVGHNQYYFAPFYIAFEDKEIIKYLLSNYRLEVLNNSLRFELDEKIGPLNIREQSDKIILKDNAGVPIHYIIINQNGRRVLLLWLDLKEVDFKKFDGFSKFFTVQIVAKDNNEKLYACAFIHTYDQVKNCIVVDITGRKSKFFSVRLVEEISANSRAGFLERNLRRFIRYSTLGIFGRHKFLENEIGKITMNIVG